jgi:3-deoxy-7-phosphoheptulonate synthase
VRRHRRQVAGGDDRIVGVMVESHLVAGRQDLVPGKELTYGQSVTDGCIDWDASVAVLEGLAAAVRQRRLATQAAEAAAK